MNKLLQPPVWRSGVQLWCRNYAFKSDLKIKWVRPEKILCTKPAKSGDQALFPDLDKTQYVLEFQNSKELQTASEPVQRLFQLGFNRRKKSTEFYEAELLDSVKRHDLDLGSMEAKLASMTASIRSMQQELEKFPRNKRLLVACKEMIDCRKKFLRHLRVWDYRRFEWVLEKLDLIYKAYPAQYHWITRKESLTKLTALHCERIRDERLAAYRQELEQQQVRFLEEKLSNLKFIRSEQQECAVPVTVTPEQIAEVQQKLATVLAKQQELQAAVAVEKSTDVVL